MQNEQNKDPLTNALEDTPVIMSDTDKDTLLTHIINILSQTNHLRTLINEDMLRKSDANTLLYLTHNDLNHMDDILTEGRYKDAEIARLTNMLQESNNERNELRQELGQSAKAHTITYGLRHYMNALYAWLELTGFHYASMRFEMMGITCDISHDIDHKLDDPRNITFGDKALAAKAASRTPYRFDEHTRFDLYRDSFHDELLDTDNNREQLKQLFRTVFPESRLQGFSVRFDRELALLRTYVYVPYADIQKWSNEMDN